MTGSRDLLKGALMRARKIKAVPMSLLQEGDMRLAQAVEESIAKVPVTSERIDPLTAALAECMGQLAGAVAAKIADPLELGEETEQKRQVLDAEHKKSMTEFRASATPAGGELAGEADE